MLAHSLQNADVSPLILDKIGNDTVEIAPDKEILNASSIRFAWERYPACWTFKYLPVREVSKFSYIESTTEVRATNTPKPYNFFRDENENLITNLYLLYMILNNAVKIDCNTWCATNEITP